MELEQKFNVIIEEEVHRRMTWLTKNYSNEISAWLTGKMTKDTIFIDGLLFPHQEVGSASVDTDGESLIKLRNEYGDKCTKIIGHWHSHNTMSAFWSTTDDKFMEEFIEPRDKGIFIVSSKKDGFLVRLELNSPFRLSLDDLDFHLLEYEEDIEDEMKKVIKDKVTEEVPTAKHQVSLYSATSSCYPTDDMDADEIDETQIYQQSIKQKLKEMLFYEPKDNKIYVQCLNTWESQDILREFQHVAGSIDDKTKTITFKPNSKERAIELLQDLSAYIKKEVLGEWDYTSMEELY